MKLRHWLLTVLVVVAGITSLLAYDYNQFMGSALNIRADSTVRIDVIPGRSIKSIANELALTEVIERPQYLSWVARLSGQARRIQAGEYAVANGTSYKQFLDMLVEGRVVQYGFTIIEGWNVAQVLQAAKNNKYLKHTLGAVTATQLMKRLGLPADLHAEGWLFPDTYYFVRGESDVNVLLRAQKAMQKNLNNAWKNRESNLPYDTPYDALIMASIIEKETGKGDERSQIAGVFVRRLRKGMRLQTDPTVIYGMGDKYKGNIRRKDLKKDTPYNTYTRKGMPPTPIAMPGLAAIEAALHPAKGTTLYFVAKGDGSHVFSSTLQQHNEAVIEYQLNGKRKGFSSFKAGGKE